MFGSQHLNTLFVVVTSLTSFLRLKHDAEASKTTAASIESHNITEGPSTAVSDAAVTIGGLTMRGIVDQPHPIDPEGGETSYTAALEMATGVEAVEGAASFVTADDGESPGNENEADVDLDPTTSAEMSRKGEVHPTHMSPSGTALLAHFEELDDEDEYDVGTPHTGFDTGRTVGPQSLAFMEGGQRYCHQAQARFVLEIQFSMLYNTLPASYHRWHLFLECTYYPYIHLVFIWAMQSQVSVRCQQAS